jgi:hypothetical protein
MAGGKWAFPGHLRASGAYDLEVVAAQDYAHWGGIGQPVACVVFTVTDQHSHTLTATVTTMSLSSKADGLPCYKLTLDPAGNASIFTAGDTLTCNFKVYPWVGDSTSVFDSSIGFIPTSSGTPALAIGETITQTTTNSTAVVSSVSAGYVFVTSVTWGTATPFVSATANWTGGTSGVTFTPTGLASAGWVSPAPDTGPLTLLWDVSNTYGVTVAYVDPTSKITGTVSGTFTDRETITQATSGSTGRVIGAQSASPILVSAITGTPNATNTWTGTGGGTITSPSAPVAQASGGVAYDIGSIPGTPGTYATPAAAMTGIAAYNNTNHSRNTADASFVYLMRGDHFTGATTATTANNWFITITRAPGLAQGEARIIGRTASVNTGPRLIRVYDLDILLPSDTFILYGGSGFLLAGYLDSCRVTSTTATDAGVILNNCRVKWSTFNTVTNVLNPFYIAGIASRSNLDRGNTITGCSQAFWECRCLLKNRATQKSTSTAYVHQISDVGATNVISGYNFLTTYGQAMSWTPANTKGHFASMCDEVEHIGSGTNAQVGHWNDGVTNQGDNVARWHNGIHGERTNEMYNDVSGAQSHNNVSLRYNNDSRRFTKSDGFTPVDPTRNRNWPTYYGTGVYGCNMDILIGNGSVGQPAGCPKYIGVGSKMGTAATFVNDASGSGGAGGGDYTPAVNSIARSMVPAGKAVLPFDRLGQSIPNDGTGAAGAIQRPADFTYLSSGPSTGASGQASTAFTVTLAGTANGVSTVTLTASDGTIDATAVGGSISNDNTGAVTVTPAAGATGFTFTYTPASAGSKTLTYTNAQSWTNPGTTSYTATSSGSAAAVLTSAFGFGFGF